MTDYTSTDDAMLLQLSQQDCDAEEELVRRYMRKVRICSRRFYLLGGDNDDLIQEGTVGLLAAVRSYNSSLGVSFNTYAEKCIVSKLIDATHFKGYSEYIFSDDLDIPESADEQADPEVLYLANEHRKEVVSQLGQKLSKFERSVLGLFLRGSSYSEIAAQLGKSNQSVYNAIQRVRIKLSELL